MIAKGQHDNGEDNTEEINIGWILPAVNTTEVLEQQLIQKIREHSAKIVSDGS